jgi:hypothetical protein
MVVDLAENTTPEWSPLDHLLDEIADAWYRPEGERSLFRFRVARERLAESVTIERLLAAASIPVEEFESCRIGDDFHNDLSMSLNPIDGEAFCEIEVATKPRSDDEIVVESESGEITADVWHALETAWKSIATLESTIDGLRLSMGGLASEMDSAFKRPLSTEDKLHALQADMAQWSKAKSRITYSLPKVREFVHRATWAAAAEDRRQLAAIAKQHIEPRVPFANPNETRRKLELLLKDRQVLLAQGNAVNQECRSILSEVQRAASTLQRNASERAKNKRRGGWEKGKHL